jgi:hypothetical protein
LARFDMGIVITEVMGDSARVSTAHAETTFVFAPWQG